MHAVRRWRRRGAPGRWLGALLVAGAFIVVVAVPAAQAAPKPGSACKAKEVGRIVPTGDKVGVRCEHRDNAYRWSKVTAESLEAEGWEEDGDSEEGGSAVGSTCATPGALDTAASPTLVCRGGKWRYATYDDAPRGPFTKRPSWYPRLAHTLGGDATAMPCPKKGVALTHSVVPEKQLVGIEPYGLLIGGHVTPIDHAYIAFAQWSKPKAQWSWQPVTSPGDGVIIDLGSLGGGVSRVVIDHGCEVFTVYMVLDRVSGVLAQADPQRGLGGPVPVKAGQEFGQQRDHPLDFNVFDGKTWLRGLNPFTYLSGDAFKLYTADPSRYFTPRLARLYESVLLRTARPRWGKIDLDLPGSAQGNWFLRETNGYLCWPVDKLQPDARAGATPPGKKDYSWCHLALVPHVVDTSTWMASFGWWADPAGDPSQFVLEVAGKPTPAKLRPSHGAVVYRVSSWEILHPDGSTVSRTGPESLLPLGYRVRGAHPQGLVALRVNGDGSLTVETVPGATQESEFTGFTAAARTYVH